MAPLVRPALLGDIERLTTLSAEVQDLHVAARPDHFRPVRSDELAAWFGHLLADPDVRIWVSEGEAGVAGFAVVRERRSAENPYCVARTWWDVDQISVEAAQRKTGTARALVERIAAEARAAGVRTLELNCWAFNRDAQQAFARLGFLPKTMRLELALAPPGIT